MKIIRAIAAWLPALLAVVLLLTVLPAQWKHYRGVCPSTDVLTWDGNLRLTAVADQYDDFRSGRVLRATISLLDAPTWPAFRGVVSLGVFAFTGGPDVRRDVAVTFFFFCALFASLLFTAIRLSGSVFVGGMTTLLASLLLIHSRDLNMFALSAMLETQGMFFMLWTAYFVYRLYASSEGAPGEKLLVAGLFVSTQGVFHTKYPYGVVLLLALVGAEVLSRPLFYLDFAKRLHREHFGPRRLALIGVFLAAIVLAARAGLLGDASPNPRLAKRLVYLGFLILVVDFNIHVYRRRARLREHLPRSMKMLYVWGVLPALIWLFMHPTRFNTTLGTQQRLPPGADAGSISYARLFFRQFDQNWILILFVCAALVCLAIIVVLAFRRSRVRGALSGDFARDALFMVTLGMALQWIVLEFSTPNKQPRHVYHLLPALFVLVGLWIARGLGEIDTEKRGFAARVPAIGVSVLVFTCAYSLVSREPGLLSGEYFNGRNLCANLPRKFYGPARRHAAALRPSGRYVVINTYHESGPPGRLLASHTDLLLRMRVRGKGRVRNDSRHRWKTWREFDRLMVLAANCSHPLVLARVEKRARDTGSRLKLLRERKLEPGKYCYREYQITGGR